MARSSEPISDRQLVQTLRPFVRAASPVLDGLREADPFGLRQRLVDRPAERPAGVRVRFLDRLAKVRAPGTSAWAAMDVAEREAWWINRVGRFTALVAAIPGLGGALAERLPVTDVVGVAGQGLVLCAIAGEHGVTDVGDRVRLLAFVLFGRDIAVDAANLRVADETRLASELAGDAGSAQARGHLRTIGAAVWRLGRTIWSIPGELGKRPQGRFYHKLLAALPVVGVLGAYFGERSALRRAAKKADKWLRAGRSSAARIEAAQGKDSLSS